MAEKTSSGSRMVLVLIVISVCSGALLALTRAATRDAIESAERAATQRAIVAVLPSYGNKPDLPENQVHLFVKGATVTCYVARESESPESPLIGVAIPGTSEEGYGGPLIIMVGILPDGSIHGLRVLQHTETPGLGSNVRDDPSFLQQFLGHSRGEQGFDWEVGGHIQALTSATITSRAATDAILNALEVFQSLEIEVETEGEAG